MPPEPQQAVPAGRQRIEQGKARQTPARAFRPAVRNGQHEARPAIPFGQPGGNDPDHARMPSLSRHDDDPVVQPLRMAGKTVENLGENRRFGFLTVDVERLDVMGKQFGLPRPVRSAATPQPYPETPSVLQR